ncbi:cellulose synthase complex outer membrane protein BcsC [Enterobacteriaceae bacterium H20N1]|uniref:Cellulose synthase complex outer membrane protein BcsC n=1 Tax=Dryocola boscaweniae TaxID=2925397 RepID=A0A9X2W931_9ENTR|nr:cellulose synthase complex outer membrane protein BcsC [Dryocola boscaweniae]MCT4703331.1 cellulose synthase complex outer membrane protein BcsC [Dryocola boscaweniae]MCT4720499.1 cellulose synthase complex outer membrane protein BcsC [Dryocola boscaweniae]
MHKYSINIISLSLGLLLMPWAVAAVTPQQQLLEQVRLGEASKREDLVRQSLYRLELMDPDNPDVIAARMRYLLRLGDNEGAKKQLGRLSQLAPSSSAYQQSVTTMTLSTPEGRQQLQQARLLATTGHTAEAAAAYEKIFNGNPPAGDLAVEYWTLMAKEPARRRLAIDKLKALNAANPGNAELRSNLARLLFASGRSEEGFTVLEQMAKSNNSRQDAAQIWYDQISHLPVSDASVAALTRFLGVFTEGETVTAARAKLAEQQKQLSDPAFKARAQGLANVETGRGGKAVAQLQEALASGHNDSEAVGALGQAYSQQGNRARAVQQLEKAIRMDPNSDNRSKWDSLLQTNRYWLLIAQGDEQLKANNLAGAQLKYQQARRVDNTDSYAVIGLGDVAVARKDDVAAERFYQQALRMDRGNSNAVRGLANVYRRQSTERATAFIHSLSASQRRSIDDIERSLEGDRLEQEAAALESQGQWGRAAEVQRRRLQLDPESVWITYRLGKDLYAAGKHSEADVLMRGLAKRRPADPEQVYANGLYLSGNNQADAALAHLNTLPRGQWNDNINELAERLQNNRVLETANRLRDGGKEAEAIALLKQQPRSDRIDLTLADWATQRDDHRAAVAQYQQVLQRDPKNADARLGLAEEYVAQGDKTQAREQLTRMQQAPASGQASMNTERRIANIQSALGDKSQAEKTFSRIIPAAKIQPPSMESAQALRDAARFQAENHQPQQALETYSDAMVSSGVAGKRPADNDTFTRLTRNDAKDDWLKRGVRSDAADLYRQQDVNVTLDHDYWGASGTPGYSDLQAHTTMLQVDAPLSDGRMWFRTDIVNMDAGTFNNSGDGGYNERWGTCAENACSGSNQQRANGASLAVGWKNTTWNADIGTTPLGFDVVDVVGGVSYSNDLGPLGYTLNAHRRPISSSMLSFAGQRDPNTNTVWGGVRATGIGVSTSYDKGEANGVWASLSGDTLTGKNVEDNWRVRFMTGYYYKLINENNRRLTVGLTNMLWHYDKDLSDYFLGQGGYYSPQQYVSFAIPIIWRQRTENWSWELGGSGSWSHSKSNAGKRYPVSGLVPATLDYPDRNDTFGGSSSNGFGYTARALVERRLDSHWSIGAGIDIQEAKDYTPSHALIFVRYSQAGWQGDMNMPPQPLVPYADF